ncbi:MAG: glycosyltransferase family 4 protein [Anaerolineales bacterium]|nr:glycosyltransferase family 4 protein [Anaerolineales bacterium]
MDNPPMYRFGFIVEQALGHITHGKNLQALIPKAPDVQASWGFPAFETEGLAAKIPVYKSNWTIRAGWRTRALVATMQRQAHQTGAPLDALFFHTQVTAILSPDWLKRIPSIVSLDGTPLQYDALGAQYDHKTDPPWLENLKYRLNQLCYHRAARLVTWSAWAKESLVNDYGISAEKIIVIPPGVNVRAWLRPDHLSSPPPPSRGVADPVRILFVGGNLARKGGDLLLNAFRALRPTHPCELHLVTRDTLPPEPGLFVYNDMQPNSPALKHLYHTSDLFCLPTQGDFLPMVLSEAGAAGLPVISTRLAAIPEVVLHGETGLLTAPGNQAELTTALRTLLENPTLRQQMGQKATETIQATFDAETNANYLLTLLKQVADQPRA